MVDAFVGRLARTGLGVACAVVLAGGSLACASTSVSRIDPGTVTDLSGRWNDTDSRLVANKLIQESLSNPWAKQYAERHGGEAPAIIIGEFSNKTMEHIPVGTFVRDLERAFIGSGAVRVVASADERQEVRTERQDQVEIGRAYCRESLC